MHALCPWEYLAFLVKVGKMGWRSATGVYKGIHLRESLLPIKTANFVATCCSLNYFSSSWLQQGLRRRTAAILGALVRKEEKKKRCADGSRSIVWYFGGSADILASKWIHAFPKTRLKSAFQEKQMVGFEKPRLGCFAVVFCWKARAVNCLWLLMWAKAMLPQSLYFYGYSVSPAQPHLVS